MLFRINNMLRATTGKVPFPGGCSQRDAAVRQSMRECGQRKREEFVDMANRLRLLRRARKFLRCACGETSLFCQRHDSTPETLGKKRIEQVTKPLVSEANRAKIDEDSAAKKLKSTTVKRTVTRTKYKKIVRKAKAQERKVERKTRTTKRKIIKRRKKAVSARRKKERKRDSREERKERERYDISWDDFNGMLKHSPLGDPKPHKKQPFYQILQTINQISLPMAQRAHFCAVSPLLCRGPKSGAFPGYMPGTSSDPQSMPSSGQPMNPMRVKDMMPTIHPDAVAMIHAGQLSDQLMKEMGPALPQ
jgi:hypothetical protein